MDRMVLRDDQWERIASLVPGKVGDPGRSGADNRLFVDAVLWIVRVGAPWRDLPQDFGNWNSVFQRFRRWVRSGLHQECTPTKRKVLMALDSLYLVTE